MERSIAQNNSNHCPLYIRRSIALDSTGRKMVKSLARLCMVIFALLYLVACGSAATTKVIPAPQVTPNPYPPHRGELVLNDPLKDNKFGNKWDTNRDNCVFANDGYHVSVTVQLYSLFCVANATNFSNFAYEAQMTILKGDSGGLFWRGDSDNAKLYYFRIDTTGYFRFVIFTGHTGGSIPKDGTTSAFHQGLGKSNLIGVVAQGDSMTLYVNHEPVTTVTDRTYSHGEIGVVASSDHAPVSVVFSDARVWKL